MRVSRAQLAPTEDVCGLLYRERSLLLQRMYVVYFIASAVCSYRGGMWFTLSRAQLAPTTQANLYRE